ncbi:RNA polymerase sigma factor [Christiangramia forsetii]|uniref:RNA polymerase ECF-type sigma factor n=2 Tax=Christiangramia forsetii TaxID=411153 RepID=A0M547_CHRFK|nr:sigma-70 family RNA polymerase sigma factor [Christiangramia forsetii]GGG21866.1 DNA-directed RNA polymerase sigma-70 factor [Christiangramia forsetii]CAL67742.1 RNA polymerase ECF-type sigma factor [Christiangramia forsetii KT0803]
MVKVIQLFKNESSLIKRASVGNQDAQKRIYEMYSSKMLSICRQYIKDIQHAEDTMLKGFFKVFTHLKDFKEEGSFEGWIRKIMVREAISFLRQHKKLEFQEDMTYEASEVFNNINSEMEVADIQSLIDSLPQGYKMVFVMYAVEGYKHSEISKMLDISEGTSKSQLFKARKMLQEKLKTINSSSYGTN